MVELFNGVFFSSFLTEHRYIELFLNSTASGAAEMSKHLFLKFIIKKVKSVALCYCVGLYKQMFSSLNELCILECSTCHHVTETLFYPHRSQQRRQLLQQLRRELSEQWTTRRILILFQPFQSILTFLSPLHRPHLLDSCF